jgi:ssDNA-binding Zn-finger/Zn-ribbon topoisomerase 1
MKCPNCKQAIDHVNVFSEARQIGELKGNKVVEYSAVQDVSDETTGAECPNCSYSLMSVLEFS